MRRALGFSLLCDRVVRGGIVALILATPFAFGAVHRPAYVALECTVFALVAISALKVALAGPPAGRPVSLPLAIAGPLALLVLLGPLQLVPLPPALLHAISPATWEVLSRSLPGWPEGRPYADLQAAPAGETSPLEWVVLPTPEELAHRGLRAAGSPHTEAMTDRVPFETARVAGSDADPSARPLASLDVGGAKPLSLAPARTAAASFKILAYAALFLLILLHPWNGGAAGEARTTRALLGTLALTAAAVAAVALVQRFAWNGQILWVFVPFDWPSGAPDPRPRVSGPFINRNNLAGYLAMLLPLVAVAALLRTHLDPLRSGLTSRFWRLAGLATVVLAILLSLSRGGWLASAAGAGTLCLILRRLPRAERPYWLRSPGRVAASLSAVLLVKLALALVPFGDVAPHDLDRRLEETFSDSSSLEDRIGFWRAASRMARDFPFLGVGLGAWPEVAPRYDTTPAGRGFPREVHNDYLQLAAEAGLVGLLVVGALLVGVLRPLHASFARRSAAGLPLAAAALSGMTALAVHALVDFDLQIPAIPLALVVLVAAVLRPALARRTATTAGERRGAAAARLGRVGIAGAAAGLCLLAATQSSIEDPRRAAPASDAWHAVEAIAARPASALAHLQLFRALEPATAELRQRELEIALWLAPRNPTARDALAALLAARGDEQGALAQIEESVRIAPRTADHRYLAPRLAPWLSAAETAAIERGLRASLAEHPEAAPTLATLLASRGRSAEAAEVLLTAAGSAAGDRARIALRLEAADQFVAAGLLARAEEPLRAVLSAAPATTAAWVRLVAVVGAPLASEAALAVARREVESGLAAGADAAELWFALAELAKRRGDAGVQRDSLERALAVRPALAKLHFELGLRELADGRADRAARALTRATELSPADEAAWFHLGRAQEAAYRTAAARRSYDRVLAIDPVHPKAREKLARLALDAPH